MNELILQTGHAPVNGLQMYYEIHGTGEPLVLLHGGACTTAIFKKIMPAFSASRRVIAVDLQSSRTHGRYRPSAGIRNDGRRHCRVAEVSQYRKGGSAGLLAGGGVTLRTTIQYPALVNKLIVVAFAWKRDGWFPEYAQPWCNSSWKKWIA